MLFRQMLTVALFLLFFTFGVSAQAIPKVEAKPAKPILSVCKEIDDDWKCVGEAAEWKANTPFNVLFKNPDPVGVSFIGIVIHKQGPDGKDVDFINEYQQQIDEKSRWYATTGGMPNLPAGAYSIYIIRWDKRELQTHHGNFKEYFAKTTLVVK